jgi:twitching motility protein PilT
MTIQQLMAITVSRKASDLHLLVGHPPSVRIYGDLIPIPGEQPLTPQDMELLVMPLLTEQQKETLIKTWELDLGYNFSKEARFRINIYRQRGTWAAALRVIPSTVKSLDDINMPASVRKLTELKQGLVLVTGPTGQGKSTTLAAMINEINMMKKAHIITVEDPIEFIYPFGKSMISQRELNADTQSFTNALKYALREDPDVVLIGEMRDLETIAAAMTIAETGHLVFATLHTNSASQTIDRVIDVFPEAQQPQIRTQLAAVLEAVISQRLVPTMEPGRIMALEILFANPAVRAIIREAKTHMIDNLIQTSAEQGMVNMETSLATLVREGKISIQTAQQFASNVSLVNKLLGG